MSWIAFHRGHEDAAFVFGNIALFIHFGADHRKGRGGGIGGAKKLGKEEGLFLEAPAHFVQRGHQVAVNNIDGAVIGKKGHGHVLGVFAQALFDGVG